MDNSWKKKIVAFWKGWGYSLVVALIIAMTFRSAIAEFNDIPTGSMQPTILIGDRVLVNKLAYDLKIPFTTWHIARWGDPERGDIVVFFSPENEKRLIKRVVGLPGDTLIMVKNQLFINGNAVKYGPLEQEIIRGFIPEGQSDYLFFSEDISGKKHPVMITPDRPAVRSFGPVVVPEGAYFMMGDNRDNSADSRFFGCVDRKRIVGEAVSIFFSLKYDECYLPRWDRFFHGLS